MGVICGYCVTCMDGGGGHVWLLCDLYGWGSCVVIVWLVWMWVMFGYCVNDDPFKRT